MRLQLGLIASVLVAICCVAYALSAGQDMNWDLQNYHLYAPFAFLNDRHLLDLSPAGLQSYFNPGLYVPYFWLVNHLPPKLVASSLAIVQSLNFALLYLLALRLLPERPGKVATALLLALMGFLTVGLLSELSSSQFDNVVSLFILGALLVVLHALNNEGGRASRPGLGKLFIAGLLAGIGCAFKLVLGVYALGLAMAIFCLSNPLRIRIQLGFVFSMGVLAGILLAGGFWYFYLLANFGNPLFPMFNTVFDGELAQAVSGRDTRFLPGTIIDFLAYPVIFTIDPFRVSEIAYRQYSWIIIYFVILAFAASRFPRIASVSQYLRPLPADSQLLLVFFVVSYFLWLVLFGVYRYLVSIEVLIPLLIYLIVTNVHDRKIVHGSTLIALACLTGINSSGAADWGRAGWSDKFYQVEIPAGFDEADTIFLISQPLAWLVPAFNVSKPFIQMAPNFPVSAEYVSRVRQQFLNGSRAGFIYNPLTIRLDEEIPESAFRQFFPPEIDLDLEPPNYLLEVYLGLDIAEIECAPFKGSFGQTEFTYEFCLQRDESER